MALLHGSGGTTGKRARVDRQRSAEPDPGPVLRSLLPLTAEDDVRITGRPGDTGRRGEAGNGSDVDLRTDAGLRLDHGLSISRAGGAAEHPEAVDGVDPGDPAAALEAALLRLAAAGPTLTDVLDQLAQDAAVLLRAPARIALAVDDRLVWATSSDAAGTPIGEDVEVTRTACGAAWHSGLIQNVSAPILPNVISLDRPQSMAVDDQLTTACCGSPPVVLAVPLLREGPTVAGRHAGFFREVFAVLALSGERPGWFDDDAIEASADLAEVAGERIAALALLDETAIDVPERTPAPEESAPEGSATSALAEPIRVPAPAQEINWPAQLLPPVDAVPTTRNAVAHAISPADPMPPATTSVTVVPAGRPGRTGFGGWFSRTSKAASQHGIPTPRAGDAGASRMLSVRRTPVRTTLDLSAMPVPEQAMPHEGEPGDAVPGQPGPESATHEPATPEPVLRVPALDPPIVPEVAPVETAVPEPLVPEPLAPEPFAPEPLVPEPVGQEPPTPQAVRIEQIPKRLVRSDEPARFGPTSRLARARNRTTGGTPMPHAMPARDSMGLWQWDAVSGECTWSSPVARLLGLAPDADLTLDAVRDAVVAADRGRFDVAVQAITSGRGVAGSLRLKTPDGRAKHAYAWSEVRRDESGRVLGAWGGVVDVTAFEHDAAALRSGLAGLRAAQELTGVATWEWRPDAGRLIWSDEMYRLAGVSAETFTPTPDGWHAFVHPDDLERARRLDLGVDLEAGLGQTGERVETFRLIGRGGEIRHVQSWSATSGDRVVYGATIDVTRQVHDRMTLERLSATDPVTGLGNRLAFDRRMQQLLSTSGGARAAGKGSPAADSMSVTLILLDLDRFKVVNDSLGHQVGDRLLIEVARRLVAVVPDGSVTARMGGDEFVVVPPVGALDADVRRLADNIGEALRAPYVLPETGELLICPASLGVTMSEGRRVTGHDLLREADIALYRAKDSGRDQYVVFDEALKTRNKARQRAERRLRTALEEDRLVMQYQPVVDFSNGQVIGAEGLVRLHDSDDDDRLISPELFLDIAEQTGLVVEIDCWVIETAIQQLMAWDELADGAGPWLAINLSARSLEHPRVVRRLIEAVKCGEVDRDRIKIELTEQSFIGALPGVDAGLRQLIANGIGVGIDDFGTGYSALAHLQHFELDFMKIDRSFVSSVGEGPRGDAVVTAIVDLAHAHGMRVIAEGVESGRQARRLREIGCDFAQGFHFGRPGEADRIVRG